MKLIPINYQVYQVLEQLNEIIMTGQLEGLVIGVKMKDENTMTVAAGLSYIEALGLAELIKQDAQMEV